MSPEPDIAAVRDQNSKSFERIHRQVENYRRELFKAFHPNLAEPRPRLNWRGFVMLIRRPALGQHSN